MCERVFGTLNKGGPAQRELPGPWPIPLGGPSVAKRTCSVDGCERAHLCREFCGMHYRRWRNGGDPEYRIGRDEALFAERFWAKVDRSYPTHCWIWTGTIAAQGYGRTHFRNKKIPAHRAAWELVNGPIPEGLVIDHLCRNPPCVNPAHLEPVTNGENVRRGLAGWAAAARTHCPQGHPYSGSNLRVTVGADGRSRHRECRKCRVAAVARYRNKRRQAS